MINFPMKQLVRIIKEREKKSPSIIREQHKNMLASKQTLKRAKKAFEYTMLVVVCINTVNRCAQSLLKFASYDPSGDRLPII